MNVVERNVQFFFKDFHKNKTSFRKIYSWSIVVDAGPGEIPGIGLINNEAPLKYM